MRFIQSLRGEGVLLTDGEETSVTYQLDVFEDRMGRTGSGTLDSAAPINEGGGRARLRLADGVEIALSMLESDEDGGAVFETRAAPPR